MNKTRERTRHRKWGKKNSAQTLTHTLCTQHTVQQQCIGAKCGNAYGCSCCGDRLIVPPIRLCLVHREYSIFHICIGKQRTLTNARMMYSSGEASTQLGVCHTSYHKIIYLRGSSKLRLIHTCKLPKKTYGQCAVNDSIIIYFEQWNALQSS